MKNPILKFYPLALITILLAPSDALAGDPSFAGCGKGEGAKLKPKLDKLYKEHKKLCGGDGGKNSPTKKTVDSMKDAFNACHEAASGQADFKRAQEQLGQAVEKHCQDLAESFDSTDRQVCEARDKMAPEAARYGSMEQNSNKDAFRNKGHMADFLGKENGRLKSNSGKIAEYVGEKGVQEQVGKTGENFEIVRKNGDTARKRAYDKMLKRHASLPEKDRPESLKQIQDFENKTAACKALSSGKHPGAKQVDQNLQKMKQISQKLEEEMKKAQAEFAKEETKWAKNAAENKARAEQLAAAEDPNYKMDSQAGRVRSESVMNRDPGSTLGGGIKSRDEGYLFGIGAKPERLNPAPTPSKPRQFRPR
jgi:hypothetical protein